MTPQQPLRAVLYCRISEKKVSHDSVAVQEKNLRDLAKAHGYEIIEPPYVDDGISAYSGAVRPQWLALLKNLKKQKFDVILAVAEDRLARNTFENVGLQRDCIAAGVRWHTPHGGLIDPSNAHDGLLASITGALAEYESSVKKERLRARFEDEISQGNALWGTRPFGYDSARSGKVIPAEGALILEAYEVILNGGTLYEIAKGWNASRVLTTRGNAWSYQTVRQLLLRPRNARLVVRDRVVLPDLLGNWEALVTPEVLADTKAILTSTTRRTAPGRKGTYLCSGLIQCSVCGSNMRSSVASIHGVKTPHYRCASKLGLPSDTRRHVAIATGQLDPMVRAAVVSAFLFGKGTLKPDSKATDTAPMHKRLAEIRTGKQELIALIKMNLSTAAEVAQPMTSLNSDEAAELAKLKAAAEESAHAAMTVDLRDGLFNGGTVSFEDAVKARVQLGERFDGLDLKQQKELVAQYLEITIHPGRKLKRIEIMHKVVTSLNDPEGD